MLWVTWGVTWTRQSQWSVTQCGNTSQWAKGWNIVAHRLYEELKQQSKRVVRLLGKFKNAILSSGPITVVAVSVATMSRFWVGAPLWHRLQWVHAFIQRLGVDSTAEHKSSSCLFLLFHSKLINHKNTIKYWLKKRLIKYGHQCLVNIIATSVSLSKTSVLYLWYIRHQSTVCHQWHFLDTCAELGIATNFQNRLY